MKEREEVGYAENYAAKTIALVIERERTAPFIYNIL